MTTNYGNTTTSGNDTWQENQGSNNQYGALVSSVPLGQVSALNVYMAGGLGGTARTRLCLWDSSGNLVVAATQFTAAAGSGSVNGQAFHRSTFTPVLISAGNYFVGFWRNGADAAEFSYNNGVGSFHPGTSAGVANVSSPGSLSISTSHGGLMSAYLEWSPAGVYGNHTGGLAPVTIINVYGNHVGGIAPVVVQGVYRGPSGGGAPIQIF